MHYFSELLFVGIFLSSQVFSTIVYNVSDDESIFNFTKNIFSFTYQEKSIYLKNPFDVSIQNFSGISLTNFCEPEDLSISLSEMGDILGLTDNPFSNPEILYIKPYLFYIDDLMDKLFYKKLEFDSGKNIFIEKETNFFNIMTPNIPKNSMIRFYYQKKESRIIVFINNYVYKINLEEEKPKVLDDVYQIEGVKLHEVSDLIIFSSGFLFLSENNSILYYAENKTDNEANLIQTIDHTFLNLSDLLNITSFSFDYETNTLAFSDYLNGIYFLKLEKGNLFSFINRLNDGKVLQIDYQYSSLIMIKEVFKTNISSIVLQEYLENDEEFNFNREIYLSSLPQLQSLVRTPDFLAILEPNLIHLYRTSLNKDNIKLEENEVYREFQSENFLQILSLSSHNDNDGEFFFLGVKKNAIKLFYPQINSIVFNCTLELNKNFKYSTKFDVEIKYLNCLEKKIATDHDLENYCSKKVHMKLSVTNSKAAAFLQRIVSSNKIMQWTFSIAIGTCGGVMIGVIIGILLKKKYNSLKISYKILDNHKAESITNHSPKLK